MAVDPGEGRPPAEGGGTQRAPTTGRPPTPRGGPMWGPRAGIRGGGYGWGPRRRLSTETRRSPETSEFWIFLAAVAGVLIASAVIDGGNGDDYFRADEAWIMVIVLVVGYLLSRGWAKSGTRELYWDDGADRGLVGRAKDVVTGDDG